MLQYKPNSSLQNISTKLSDVRINEDNKEPIVITDETRDIPFNSFDDIKESYFAIINLGFEQLDIVKIN